MQILLLSFGQALINALTGLVSGYPTNQDFECNLESSGIIACKDVAKP